jgi:thiamine kinase-like enzyme
MKHEDILSGKEGLAGIHWLLNSQSSRRRLRNETEGMLRPGYHAGAFHLTRAKFKPDRKLQAYFNFLALDERGQTCQSVQLAVSWLKNVDNQRSADGWSILQEEANRAGLMAAQRELWRNLPDQGLGFQLWPFDPEFPHLVRLGDPAHVASMLASLGFANHLKQSPVVTPIRYRPGERHVLRYEFSSPETAPGEEQRLYAKLYSNAGDAAKALGIANRVVDWLSANDMGLQGNRPAAISPEESVILYSQAPGIPLSRLLHRSRPWLAKQLQTIGRGLATLHSGPETLQAELKQNNFSKEAKVVRRASEHIEVLLPKTHTKILKIVSEAEEGYSRSPQETPTFTHADFKADHIISTQSGLTLIDFDTCTLTDPALDIGKFLADLDWWFALLEIPGVEDAQAELLKGYVGGRQRDQALNERLRRARFFHVLILVKIVARRVPIFQKEWATRTSSLIERAAYVLDETGRP